MLVSDAPKFGFRALQAVTDLRAAAARQPESARHRIAAGFPAEPPTRVAGAPCPSRDASRDAGDLLVDAGPQTLAVLLEAAREPEPEPEAFVLATALLLARLIETGRGPAGLDQLWVSYRTVYFGLEPHDRSAIVHGFLTAAQLGLLPPPSPPPQVAHLTCSEQSLRADLLALAAAEAKALAASVFEQLDRVSNRLASQHLQGLIGGQVREALTGDSILFEPLFSIASKAGHPANLGATALLLAEAIRSNDGEGWFGVTLWPECADHWLSLEPPAGRIILSGLRHLYEADPNWVPEPAPAAEPEAAAPPPLLPVLDENYGRRPEGLAVG